MDSFKIKKPRKRIERKGKEFKPGSYSPTDSAEAISITLLRSFLDPTRVKCHIVERDKLPNLDGYVELVDKEQRPLGQIDVQVKTLSDALYQRRAFSADEGFLGHARQAMRPVILLAVNHRKRTVVWVQVTRAMVRELEDQGTLTIRFPLENEISSVDGSHYQSWLELIERFHRKIDFVDSLEIEKVKQAAIKEALASIAEGVPIEQSVDVGKIQEFLNELNALTWGQFQPVATFYYRDARKLGFAYSSFEQTNVSYALYGIGKQSTDADIKKVPSELFKGLVHKGLTIRFNNRENPILTRPKELARDLIRDQLLEMIELRALDLRNESLAREVIFAVVDKIPRALGLSEKDVYTTAELQRAVREYLPRWLAATIDRLKKHQLPHFLNHYNGALYFDVEWLNAYHSGTTEAAVRRKVEVQIRKKVPCHSHFLIGSRDLPIRLFTEFVDFLEKTGTPSVERLYPRFDYTRTSEGPWSFKWLTPQNHKKKLGIIFDTLPGVFSALVQRNFPRLTDHITYFDKIDRQIFVLKTKEQYFAGGFRGGPTLESAFLKLTSGKHEPFQEVYAFEDQAAPKLGGFKFARPIKIGSFTYELRSSATEIERLAFDQTPLLTEVHKLLKERFETYFLLQA